jgi:hypothetical protein
MLCSIALGAGNLTLGQYHAHNDDRACPGMRPGFAKENLMAGYSGTPLSAKLGIKANHRALFVGAPDEFRSLLDPLPEGVEMVGDMAPDGEYDIIVFFAKSRAELASKFAKLKRRLESAGGFWISWPKKSSGVQTDLTENTVREIGLAAGLVDNKVCAIDDTWSGLRFVIRIVDRPKKRSG